MADWELYASAAAEAKAGRLESAVARYDLALTLDPLFSEAWCNRGDVLFQRMCCNFQGGWLVT